MKKIFFALLIALFVISTASAFEFDNTKKFTKNATEQYGTITVKNLWGMGADLATYRLEKNTQYCYTECEAQGTLVLNEEGKLFDSMSFKDDKGKVANLKDSKYYISTQSESYTDYIETPRAQVCDTVKQKNGTWQSCYIPSALKNPITKTRPIWTAYHGEVLPVGSYQWKLVGQKNPTQTIDWIGTSKGIEMNEWAFWIGQTPAAYWKLNETSGTNWWEYTSSVLNFTTAGSPIIVAAKLGNGVNVTYSGGFNSLVSPASTNWSFGTGDLSMCAWLNVPPGGGGGSRIHIDNFGDGNWANNNGWAFSINGAGNIAITGNGASLGSSASTTYNDGIWHRICWVRSGSENRLYGDSINIFNFTNGNDFNTNAIIKVNGNGAGGGDTTAMKSMIDDFQIFKGYAWSQADITYDYNGGTGREADIPADSAPSVTLTSPTNASTLTDSNQFYFAASHTDSTALANTTLYLFKGNTLVNTNFTTITGLSNTTNLSIANSGEGNYTWYYLTKDSINQIGYQSTNNTFQYLTTSSSLEVALETPANNEFITAEDFSFRANITPVLVNATNITFYLTSNDNSVWTNTWFFTGLFYNPSNTNVSDHGFTTPFDGKLMLNGNYSWRAVACWNISNGTEGCSFSSNVTFNRALPVNRPLFDSPTPTNGSNIANNNVTIKVNVTSTSGTQNLTVYLMNASKQVNNATSNGALFNNPFTNLYNNLPDGRYFVNASYTDKDGNNNVTSETRTFLIDSSAPRINLTSPNYQIPYASIGTNLSMNFSAWDSGGGLQACWYNVGGANITIPCGGSPIGINVTSSSLTSLIIYANDTLGNVGMNTTNWSYGIFQNSFSYNPSTYETSREDFIINFSSDPSVVSVTTSLNYNGTTYPSISSCSSGQCISNATINIPLLTNPSLPANISFYFSYIVYLASSSNTYTSSSSIQTVSPLNLSSCTYGTVALNFTSYDEQNKTRIKPYSFDGEFKIYTGTGEIYRSLNVSNSNTDEIDLCIAQNTTQYIDAIIAYSAPNSTIPYTTRNYFYQRKPISNITEKVPLNLLRSSQSTSFVLQVQSKEVTAVPQVLIDAQRCYPGLNTNESAFIARTDANGLTVGNFEAETGLYKFFITNRSEVLLTIDQCSNIVPQTTPYTLLFQLGSAYSNPFGNIFNLTDINQTMFYNSTTGLLTLTYVDSSDKFNYTNLLVTSMNYSGFVQPIICSSNSSNSAASITCNVSTAGTYSAKATFYRTDSSPFTRFVFIVETMASTFSYYGVFLAFIILLVCAFMFKFNEIAAIVILNIAIILINYIGLVAFGWQFITAMIAVSIVIVAVIER